MELGRIKTPEHENNEDLERESENLDFTNAHALWTGQETITTAAPRHKVEDEGHRESAEKPTQSVVGLTAAFLGGNSDDCPPVTDNVVA